MLTSQYYRTLFYGLRHNHERNVAIVHPLMFLVRRVIYALVIVFLAHVMFWGVWFVMYSCLVMLAFALAEWQWREPIINYQHIIDEWFIYMLCLLLLCFSNYVSSSTRWMIGYIFILVCFIYIVFNTIVIFYCSLVLIWKYIKRLFI